MAPQRWAGEEELAWLVAHIGEYMDKKASRDQIEFFTKLEEAWFKKWPAEGSCGVPARESGERLTEEQALQLGNFILKRKKQLREWYRNHAAKLRQSGTKPVKKDNMSSIAAALWQESKRRQHDPQLLELWMKKFPERVKAALEAAGYDTKHAGDMEWVSQDGQGPGESDKQKLKDQASARMRMWRWVTMAVFEAESDTVKGDMEADLVKIKTSRATTQEPIKLTPALAQMSLDQLEGIMDRIHALILAKTGWVGFSMFGGPTPNAAGALRYSIYSCGFSPAGNTFKDSHPDWKEGVAERFTEWLHRCFTRSDRDAMALLDPEDILEDLIAMPKDAESDAETEKPAADLEAAPKSTPAAKSKAPKRAPQKSTLAACGSTASAGAASKALLAGPSAMFTSFPVAQPPSTLNPSRATTPFEGLTSAEPESQKLPVFSSDVGGDGAPDAGSFAWPPLGLESCREWFAAPASPVEGSMCGVGGYPGEDPWDYQPPDPMDLPKGMGLGEPSLGDGLGPENDLGMDDDLRLDIPLSPGITAVLNGLMAGGPAHEGWNGQSGPKIV
ncbi:hypothetical protein DFH09DRAFT_1349642 [Mycena vulgaris]|nr:hypothetical protein DFH09DRAFT_1349642 [Mycena vulgaris]